MNVLDGFEYIDVKRFELWTDFRSICAGRAFGIARLAVVTSHVVDGVCPYDREQEE
jgi:hypothetical protein